MSRLFLLLRSGFVKTGLLFQLAGICLLGSLILHSYSENEEKSLSDQSEYELLMDFSVTTLDDLVAWWQDQVYDWLPLLPPDTSCVLRQSGYPNMLPFESLPSGFVKGLVGHYENSVVVYPVEIQQARKTIIFMNADGKRFYSMPIPKDFGTYYEDMQNVSRIHIRMKLIHLKDVEHYFYAKSCIEQSVMQTTSFEEGVKLLRTGGASNDLWLAVRGAGQDFTNGIELNLYVPDSMRTNDFEIYKSTTILTQKWSIIANNLVVPAGSNSLQWIDYTANSNTVRERYYLAAFTNRDTDVDGWCDAHEKFIYRTDYSNSSSYPVTISGRIDYAGNAAGLIYVVAAAFSNSWESSFSVAMAHTGDYVMAHIPNLQDLWFKAYRDVDANGIREEWEPFCLYSSTTTYICNDITNVDMLLADPDSDEDNLPDWWEMAWFDHLSAAADDDIDEDNLNNLDEYILGTSPVNADTDSDSVYDGDELGLGEDPLYADGYVLYSDFEQVSGYSEGALLGQEGWSASSLAGVAVVPGIVRRGTQSVALQALEESCAKSCLATGPTVRTKAFVYLGSQSVPPTNLPGTASSLVSYDSTNGLVAFDGNGSGGGEWVSIADTCLPEQWIELEIEQDYTTDTWILSVNGEVKQTNLGFKDNSLSQLNTFHLCSGSGGAVQCDDIIIINEP
ncbi:MAG: hypothetical protein EOM20_11675 [Spartobacteria bacterium]|nr:hypothetical protein [Spartobacteria bacterium]